MRSEADTDHSERVIVVAPTNRDGEVTCRLLKVAGVECVTDRGLADLGTAVQEGVGALMLTDISLADGRSAAALHAIKHQPEWSSVPVLVLCRDGVLSPSVLPALHGLRNVTVLDRPTSTRSMVSAVKAALRGRRWQYEIRNQLLELKAADTALRLADRRKDEFLATLAHELRNPLAPIRTGVQLLDNIREDATQFTRVRQMMERQLVQLVKLIDELLDVSRIATGKIVLQREPLDLRDVVRTAIESCQPALDAAKHHLSIELPAFPVPVSGDRTRLAQAFSNVLQNAAKYTADEGQLAVAIEVTEGQASVSVTDNGYGIPAEMLSQVFDLFAQVDRTLDRAQGGLGIGLSLVRSLVALHGGTISAASAGIGQGSLFTIRLPLANVAGHAEPRGVERGEAAVSRRLRVLVVDDNADAADSLGLMLNMLGHETRVEYRGDSALVTAEQFSPDAIFCDLGMPAMSGLDFASRVSGGDGAADQPLLVAVTGWGTREDKGRTQRAGFHAHLTKPVSRDSVREVLQRI